MKKILLSIVAVVCATLMTAQDLSQFKALDDSLFLNNATYANGNKYQRDAMLFVDMLADTHPYYITQDRRDLLFAAQPELLRQCASCTSDSAFVDLLIATLGDLHDKHTEVIDPNQLEAKMRAAQQREQLAVSNNDAIMAFKGDLFHYVIVPEHKVCYLQFNQCVDARTARNEALPRWDTMLDEMFAQMKKQGIKRLVVDAQYNNGGSSMLCDELLIRLCPLSQLRTLSTSMRFSRLMAAYNPRIAVAKQSWEDDGHIDELYPLPQGQVGPGFVQPEVFDGKVIFVQSDRTYSSAGILMTLARDNNLGLIVGTESSFSPSHYGEILPYRLPNTGVIGTISCKYFTRPDKAHVDDKTLVPDVTIDLTDKAKAWDTILRALQ
ncbi:MAG: S41 family peptidase [Muribaculaceae bacterium]|nr:S41 family peptidase [Muribaculaceae bacterium]